MNQEGGAAREKGQTWQTGAGKDEAGCYGGVGRGVLPPGSCACPSCCWPAADTTITIAEDPKHLGARIGITAVLHTWGSAMTHRPHVHMIVPGGGFSEDRSRWVACRPDFFFPVRVLSRLFRRRFLLFQQPDYICRRVAWRESVGKFQVLFQFQAGGDNLGRLLCAHKRA